MRSAADALMTPVRPTDADVNLARASSSKLGRVKVRKGGVTVTVGSDRDAEDAIIPEIAFQLLQKILEELALGHAVALAPLEREVSTQTAADVLNVSRPYLIKLLETGKIPFRKTGTHRRIRLTDVLEYKARMDADADRAYAELVQQAQELGMGYE
jgi:excisionase family DNA binding protein